MHHIVNEHAWIVGHGDPDFNHCLHAPLDEVERDKSWLHPVRDASALRESLLRLSLIRGASN
ncbi:hypothetical protein DPMN_104078 [Dreissena polymorpha]|uniref:Uncharacterized protein n=1 Tax=Dreissena polymorpha TaxID=45954 RepID=A0A9D4K2W2_DREPO|nr:hypothetical protein DPMN_104078 [Dreissena polymorpha]